jgi:hypothetical protein
VGATAAVKGLGGVGKSVLARGYAWENRARYHGVWWLRAQSPDTILDDLIELGCRIVNPGLREWPDRRAAAQAVLDAIAQQKTDKPWLLVYDNAEAPEGVRDLIPPAGAHALLTTRWQDWYGEATEVRVGVFPRETATEYLMARARGAAEQPVETRAAAARLAEDLGFLPLALALARADAWGRNWTFAQYRTHISEMLRREPTKAVDYPNSVYATFTAALDRAAASAPEAETLMGLCAFLAPDNIPLDLVDAQEMAEIAKGDAVAALAEVSLATLGRFPDGAPSLDVHRLVQRVMKERLGAGAAEVAGRAAAMVARGYPGGEIGPDDVRSWPMCARLEEHAKAVLETAPETGETAASTSLLLNQVALHWNARAGYAAAEPLMRRALAIDEASYPGSCIRHEELVGDRGVVC